MFLLFILFEATEVKRGREQKPKDYLFMYHSALALVRFPCEVEDARCLSELSDLPSLCTPDKHYTVVSTKKQEFLIEFYLVKKKKYYY